MDERTDDSEIYIMINLTERDVRREKSEIKSKIIPKTGVMFTMEK